MFTPTIKSAAVLALATAFLLALASPAIAGQQGPSDDGAGAAAHEQAQTQTRSREGSCTREQDCDECGDCDGDQPRDRDRAETQTREADGTQAGETVRDREQTRERAVETSVDETVGADPAAPTGSPAFGGVALQVMTWLRKVFAALRMAAL